MGGLPLSWFFNVEFHSFPYVTVDFGCFLIPHDDDDDQDEDILKRVGGFCFLYFF